MTLIFVLDCALAVDAGGCVYIADIGMMLHQGEQETCGPVFVDTHVYVAVHQPRDNGNAVVCIGKPGFRDVDIRDNKKII